MESQEVETYLQALDEELARRPVKKPVRLVVVGGIYMMFFYIIALRQKMLILSLSIFPIPQTPIRKQRLSILR
jgi:hypothetical protein